jgi:glycosyltransferase involved in cell wall biosynthesis
MSRLVFICPGMLGGVRSYITNLGAFLKKKGLDHLILYYSPRQGLNTEKEADAGGDSVTIHYSRFATKRSVYRALADCFRPEDVLVCSDSLELEMINYLRLPNRVIFLLHGDLEHYHSILEQYAPVIDHVSCVGSGLKVKYGRLFPNLGFSVSHPLTANYGGEGKDPAQLPLRGIFIGRFEFMKGADVFTALTRLTAAGQMAVHWSVFVTRKGSDEALLATLPPGVEVVFDASNPAVLAALENMDFLIFPSRSEGFGLAVLEGMKRGVVPFARNLPIGIPDMVIDGETGILTDAPGEIAAAISRWTTDASGLRAFKHKVRQFANDKFDYEKMGDAFVDNIHNGVMDAPVSSGKDFSGVHQGLAERLLPEWLYRWTKFLHNRINYGNRE